MPKLIIDQIAVEVAEGTTVLEAAQSVDISIPHFCWHPALGRAGACRVCAVKLLDGPVKGIQMSCMLPAQTAWWFPRRIRMLLLCGGRLSSG